MVQGGGDRTHGDRRTGENCRAADVDHVVLALIHRRSKLRRAALGVADVSIARAADPRPVAPGHDQHVLAVVRSGPCRLEVGACVNLRRDLERRFRHEHDQRPAGAHLSFIYVHDDVIARRLWGEDRLRVLVRIGIAGARGPIVGGANLQQSAGRLRRASADLDGLADMRALRCIQRIALGVTRRRAEESHQSQRVDECSIHLRVFRRSGPAERRSGLQFGQCTATRRAMPWMSTMPSPASTCKRRPAAGVAQMKSGIWRRLAERRVARFLRSARV